MLQLVVFFVQTGNGALRATGGAEYVNGGVIACKYSVALEPPPPYCRGNQHGCHEAGGTLPVLRNNRQQQNDWQLLLSYQENVVQMVLQAKPRKPV